MSETVLRGTISFVNYEKHFATIDYLQNTKHKSVNCKTNALVDGKKPHRFRVGDEVTFQLKLSDRGDKMTAHQVKFLYNTALEVLINKARVENRFSGYLKLVDEQLFVKEWESYLFFPLLISKWEKGPAQEAFNEAISFKLVNLDKPSVISAELFSHSFIPEYYKAQECYNNKTAVDALVTRISPHAVYLDLFEGKMQAKLTLKDNESSLKEGDTIKVLITHLSNSRIVVERA